MAVTNAKTLGDASSFWANSFTVGGPGRITHFSD